MRLGERGAWLSLILPLWDLLSKVWGLAPAAVLPFQGFLLLHWLSAPSPHLTPPLPGTPASGCPADKNLLSLSVALEEGLLRR